MPVNAYHSTPQEKEYRRIIGPIMIGAIIKWNSHRTAVYSLIISKFPLLIVLAGRNFGCVVGWTKKMKALRWTLAAWGEGWSPSADCARLSHNLGMCSKLQNCSQNRYSLVIVVNGGSKRSGAVTVLIFSKTRRSIYWCTPMWRTSVIIVSCFTSRIDTAWNHN